MKSLVRACVTSFALAAPLVFSGCVVDHHDWGYLLVDWSIAGQKAPFMCAQFGATSIEVTISGATGGVFLQDCGAFATTITLDDGSHAGSARLIDSAGRSRTTSVQLGTFYIQEAATLGIPTDFPADSFY